MYSLYLKENNMKILKYLGNEETTATKKLDKIKKFVAKVRETYGNTDVEIDPIKVQTTEGYVPLSLLTDEEKVAVATQQIKTAVATATVVTEEAQGSKFDRVLEAQVAINPILCNLDAVSDSEY